jgi:hypothetical protein
MGKIVYKIATLSEYINLIKNEKLESCYFRGEKRKYNGISSSLVREFSPTHDTYGLSDVYNNLLSEYYQEVGNDLDSLQRDNFLAFAQHHGLKTNLIDFTTAPLVALYFACDRSSDDKDNGYVYLLKKESTVDATDFLGQFSVRRRDHINVYGRIANHDEKVIKGYKWVLEKYEGLLTGKNPFDFVNEIISLSSCQSFCKKCHEYISTRNDLARKGIAGICEIPNLIQEYFPAFDIIGSTGISEFIALLILYFEDIAMGYFPNPLPQNIKFPRVPYLIYRTPLKFDRIRNQCGVFVYQGFLDYNTSLDDMGGIMIQEILPDIIIEVHDQSSIMQELDLVGINKKFIYGDFDSTAQYINQKYYN